MMLFALLFLFLCVRGLTFAELASWALGEVLTWDERDGKSGASAPWLGGGRGVRLAFVCFWRAVGA